MAIAKVVCSCLQCGFVVEEVATALRDLISYCLWIIIADQACSLGLGLVEVSSFRSYLIRSTQSCSPASSSLSTGTVKQPRSSGASRCNLTYRETESHLRHASRAYQCTQHRISLPDCAISDRRRFPDPIPQRERRGLIHAHHRVASSQTRMSHCLLCRRQTVMICIVRCRKFQCRRHCAAQSAYTIEYNLNVSTKSAILGHY